MNHKQIERGFYINSVTESVIKVIRVSGSPNLRYFGPGDSFDSRELPPLLSTELASRLLRIHNPKTLRTFLDEPNRVSFSESHDSYPVNISQPDDTNITLPILPNFKFPDEFPGQIRGPGNYSAP